MLEDMLTYQVESRLVHSFSELLAADLEDDARLLYRRMAADIAVVAAGAGRPWDRVRVARALLGALAAAPSARAGAWRHLYREIAALAAANRPAPEPAEGEPAEALGRLRAFLRENLDLADPLAPGECERTASGRALGA